MSQSAQGRLHGQGVEALRGLRPAPMPSCSTRPARSPRRRPKVHVRASRFNGWNRTRGAALRGLPGRAFPAPGGAGRGARRRARGTSSTASGMPSVEYLVAHGIASSLDGKRAVIGSEALRRWRTKGWSSGTSSAERIAREARGAFGLCTWRSTAKLVGGIGVDDPLKEGAARGGGRVCARSDSERIVMLTGDHECAAARVARPRRASTEYRGEPACRKTSTPASRRLQR